ncbi:regulator of chromosome condensation 1/beta-lactamase-inhibitor protein II [Dimargaris cristalligena]|uniref:Regulator of chromosome condensation 1/beta-lactamase-inhibitor protein II n=1 Tax=Dimargaris cristalligena TaxID=215637 RepID=A0A4P9ZRV5_9FUNG|nr:regulator of chromosome condensation 1/beta-lactamase-inhibitor protein II [Dimargaris cristalligena]|eukprot:RKP36193.1 regulator of chromosome condensation 1/beta-lactamase-inhibitor protein II [Dimargaris cristalligena]
MNTHLNVCDAIAFGQLKVPRLYLTMSSLWALGSNSGGQLGLGTEDDAHSPQPCRFHPSPGPTPSPHRAPTGRFDPSSPHANTHLATPWRKLTGGGNHAVALAENGQVYSCGSNQDGQLGMTKPPNMLSPLSGSTIPTTSTNSSSSSSSSGQSTIPAWVPFCFPVLDPPLASSEATKEQICGPEWAGFTWTDVACGWNHTLLLAGIVGKVYSFGHNGFGQLGRPSETLARETKGCQPRPSPTTVRPCEGRLPVNEDTNGNDNDNGEDKINDPTEVWRVNFPSVSPEVHIVQVAAGLRHSLALDSVGRVWGWGIHRHGQLGPGMSEAGGVNPTTGRNRFISHLPRQLQQLPPIRQIAGGQHHSAFLTQTDRVLVFGSNKYGQHGPPTTSSVMTDLATATATITTTTPAAVIGTVATISPCIELPHDAPVAKLVSGWSHLAVLHTDGQVFTWGRSDRGQLGWEPSETNNQGQFSAIIGQVHFPVTPSSLPTTTPAGVQSTTITTTALTTITGSEIRKAAHQTPQLTAIDLSCGSEHTLALAWDGSCWAWGWNEHGNCGEETCTDVKCPRVIRISPDASTGEEGGDWAKVGRIGCGYGFTLLAPDQPPLLPPPSVAT